jgi:hypothetical protein
VRSNGAQSWAMVTVRTRGAASATTAAAATIREAERTFARSNSFTRSFYGEATGGEEFRPGGRETRSDGTVYGDWVSSVFRTGGGATSRPSAEGIASGGRTPPFRASPAWVATAIPVGASAAW